MAQRSHDCNCVDSTGTPHFRDPINKNPYNESETSTLLQDKFLQLNSNFRKFNTNPNTDNKATIFATASKVSGNSEPNKLSLHQKKSLHIARNPIQCPISDCHRSIGITLVLSHYLTDHHEDYGVKCQETYLGKRSLLIFDPVELDFGKNICLGVLAYGGKAEESSSRPAETGLSIHNAFLPKSHEHLNAHLPILIMACRTSWSALLTRRKSEISDSIPDSPYQELLILWLASEPTTKPIHSTLTVYDKLMTSSRSNIVKVRDLNESQNPNEFIREDTNFLRLSHGEINILSQNRTECIRMEILINEYE